MPLFGPPNVAQLEAKGDVQGLIKALLYKDAGPDQVRMAAADALAPLKHPTAVDPLAAALKDDESRGQEGLRRGAGRPRRAAGRQSARRGPAGFQPRCSLRRRICRVPAPDDGPRPGRSA
jgi:hypothetical protein